MKNDVGDYELWAGAPARLIRKLEKLSNLNKYFEVKLLIYDRTNVIGRRCQIDSTPIGRRDLKLYKFNGFDFKNLIQDPMAMLMQLSS